MRTRISYAVIALGIIALVVWWRVNEKKPLYRGELKIYNWSHYMPEAVLRDFTKETGIAVKNATYSSNEEMRSKIASGAAYDLVFPTSYMVGRMAREKLLRGIDIGRLDNMNNLDPDLVKRASDAYAPSEAPAGPDVATYAVPYMWGTVGIGYDTTKVASPPNALSAFSDARFRQRVSFIDDARFVVGAFLVEQGYSANSTNEAELSIVEKTLGVIRPNIRNINSEIYMEDLEGGNAWLGFGFNGDVHQVALKNKKIAFSRPQRCLAWIDGMAIPKSAQNYNEALTFINYVLRPAVAARITNEIQYASTNKAALASIDEAIRKDTSIYVPDVQDCQYLKDIGEKAEIYEKLWQRVKQRP